MERWKTNLYILWVTQVLSLMSFGLFAPFIPLYLRELGVMNPDSLSFWTGVMAFTPAAAMIIAAPIWGILSDKYGKKLMLIRALACATVIFGAMALAANVWQLLALRILQGFFTGTVTASMAFVGANTPEHKMSFALGFLSSSGFIGYSIGPVLGGLFVESLGVRPCFLIGAAVMGIGLILAILLLKEEPLPTLPIHHENEDVKIKIPYKQLFSVAIILTLAMLLTTRMTRAMLGPYIALLAEEFLGTTVGAAKWTGIINGLVCIASAAATLTIVRLGDRYHKIKIIVILTIISLPFTILSASINYLLLFTLVYTIFSFTSGAMEPILTSDSSNHVPPKMRGTLFGVVGMINNIGFMLAPILGSFVAIQYSIQGILYLLPAFLVLQLIIGILYLKREKRFTFKG